MRLAKLFLATVLVLFGLSVTTKAPVRAAVARGSVAGQSCAPEAICGELSRPLDPNGRVPGNVSIHYRLYPATGGRATGTIVTVEGGPGYSSIGSSTGYLALFGPLRPTHNVLIVDNRGTGLSNAIDCEPLQKEVDRRPIALVDCGRQLGVSAYLYGSAEAADDLAALLDALGIAQVDLYGDSYGTFFGQTFAVKHPDRLRTLILDSAYPVIGESAWYPHQAPSARNDFNIACSRTPACAALGGSSMERIDRLIAALRAHPLRGRAPDGDGRLRAVSADPPTLFALMIAESNAPNIYRELDAAARAYFGADPLPLLRLLAEARLADPENGTPTSPTEFSEGLLVADQCGDYPQLYDLRADGRRRHDQLSAAVALERSTHPNVYAPFTIDEAQASPYNDNAIALCVGWARPDRLEPLAAPIPPGSVFPRTPVLVLSGELDTVTTPAEGREAARLFPNATWLLVPNSIHETAISDGGNSITPGADLTTCVSSIVLRFVRDRAPGSTACLGSIRPVRAVPRFPVLTRDVTPAIAAPGNRGNAYELQVAATAVATAGDVLNRYYVNYSGTGAGLRGGRFAIVRSGDGFAFTLDHVRYTSDLAMSGRLYWNQVAGVVWAELDLDGQAGSGHLRITWNERASNARAELSGSIAGSHVAATCIAP